MSAEYDNLRSALSDRYRIVAEVGKGGMATVFRAEDLKHGRTVAIKILSPDLSHSIGKERFEREVRIAARLAHPHIVQVYDSGEAGGLLYYVMPLVVGESLRDRLTREHQLPIDDRLRLAHDAPASAPRAGYQYVPGRLRGIEILPYVQTKFLDCHRTIRSDVATLLEDLLLPKKAWAIDMGGGGRSDEFSNFNVVDPGPPRGTDSPPEVIVIAPPGKPKPRIPRDQ